ncbi:MAG: hypothetical protein EBZ74_02950 [Planctomycetia bacterium]|nr:hypothetical protein [Planctomycetia bacterium]
MTLLVDFLCRFAWGLAAGLVLTPADVVPAGFFRVNLLVVLGLATFAALLAGSAGQARFWPLPAAAAATAWLGGVAWYAERPRAGLASCVACAAMLAAATVLAGPAGSLPAMARLLSGLVVGLTVHAMLLGHWYLNAPGMRVDALRRMIDAALVAWAAVLVTTAGAALWAGGEPWRGLEPARLALLGLRWLAGLAGLPALLWMSRRTLEIPNTQSATGILYVACLAAITGELTAQLLMAAA